LKICLWRRRRDTEEEEEEEEEEEFGATAARRGRPGGTREVDAFPICVVGMLAAWLRFTQVVACE
jgi:hypothetical protein